WPGSIHPTSRPRPSPWRPCSAEPSKQEESSMADTPGNPSMMSHVPIGTNHFEAARAFYDAVLAPLGVKRLAEYPGVVAYGKQYPEFWVGAPFDGQPASVGNGTHF